MKTTSLITPKENSLLRMHMIIGFVITAGVASLIVYLSNRILSVKNANPDAWVYVFALSVGMIIAGISFVKLFLDFSSKRIDDGESKITDVGRKSSSTFSRYIRLSSLGKKKIQIQYADRGKLRVGDTIRFRIAPRSRMLLSFEVGVTSANQEVVFPGNDGVVNNVPAAVGKKFSLKQLIIYAVLFGLVGLFLFNWVALISFSFMFIGIYSALIGEISNIVTGKKARILGVVVLVLGFLLFTEVAVPMLK
jgi:hypothetical protein